jgi:toxin CptA
MYGLVPAMQGPIAVALGGWDLSWLAGGLASAGSYALLGPAYHRRHLDSALPAETVAQATADLKFATKPTAPAGL